MISRKNLQLHVNGEGSLNLYFGKTNIENIELLDEIKASRLAEKLVRDFDFDNGIELKLGNITHRGAEDGTMAGSGKIDDSKSSQILATI